MSATFTHGPWAWVIEDHSMASLGVLPNPGLGDPLVMTASPCDACQDRADPREWKWGRCHTPSEADANLIAAAPDLYEALETVRDNMRKGVTGADARKGWDLANAALTKAVGQ